MFLYQLFAIYPSKYVYKSWTSFFLSTLLCLSTCCLFGSSSSSSSFNVYNFPVRWVGQMITAFHNWQSCAMYSSIPKVFISSVKHALHFFLDLPHWLSAYNPHFLYFIQQTAFCPSYVSKPSQSSLPHFNREVLHSKHSAHLRPRLPILPFHTCHLFGSSKYDNVF